MDTLEYCSACRCAVIKKDHTHEACERLAFISRAIRGDIPGEESEITLERMRGLLNHLETTMKEHEAICLTCSDFIAQDSLGRCAEYQNMREIFWKWGKRYDDTTLLMVLRDKKDG